MILLPQHPKCWDYRYATPCPTCFFLVTICSSWLSIRQCRSKWTGGFYDNVLSDLGSWCLASLTCYIGCGKLRSSFESSTKSWSSSNRRESADYPRWPGHRSVAIICHLLVHPRPNCKQWDSLQRKMWQCLVLQLN
jgi:hypothetical protein